MRAERVCKNGDAISSRKFLEANSRPIFLKNDQRAEAERKRNGVTASVQFVQRRQRPARAVEIRAEPNPDGEGRWHFAGEFLPATVLKAIKLVHVRRFLI